MPSGLSRAEVRQIESVLDRVEDRLVDAPDGWHAVGEAATAEALAGSKLPETARLLWARWDGMTLAHGAVVVFPLAELDEATARARAEDLLADGDLVIGERGRDLFVLAADPWEEGADVVLVEEDGQRNPYASTVGHLVLAELGELSIVYDEEGEFCGDLFGDDGELTPVVERRVVRRRLDLDPDAPMARFRLGQLLRRAGELRAAATELRGVLKRAPDYVWARFELARALVELEKSEAAAAAFQEAAQAAKDPGIRGVCLAWAALTSEGAQRVAHAAAALEAYPGLAAAYEAGACEAIEHGDEDHARELVQLGLAVSPRQVALLDLARKLAPGDP